MDSRSEEACQTEVLQGLALLFSAKIELAPFSWVDSCAKDWEDWGFSQKLEEKMISKKKNGGIGVVKVYESSLC